jgi:FKBP-type peptidyl-prolyl cis-trans isomerase FklB
MSVTEKLLALKNAKANENLAQGQAYLAENAKRDGVTTLESGLQYEILTEGSGKLHPEATDKVTCHYHGTLIDGRVFDSSVQRGQPATFPLNRVIKGWTEALQLMVVGDKWRLFLPADLAYGEAHVSAEIGPNSTLIFEVELLGIS